MQARRGVLLMLLVLVGLVHPVPAAAQDPTNLDELAARRKQLQRRVERALEELEELETALASAQRQQTLARQRHQALAVELAGSKAVLGARVREQYMHHMTSDVTSLLSASGPDDAVNRSAVMSNINRRDVELIETNSALKEQLDRMTEELSQQQTVLSELESDRQRRTDRLQATLDKTARKERFLRATTSAQQQVTDGPLDGNYACIFEEGVYYFIDSWGFARSGGRSHQGADVMAPRRANVYAFTDGTVGDLSTGGLGGISLRIMGDDGHRYYYAHLDAFADGITSGTRVKAGELVGYNGNSGNAAGGPTHVHFQFHPDGGAPANPYPWLKAVCP